MSAKFARCFPGDEGNIICQHWNGSWIVFPGGSEDQTEKRKRLRVTRTKKRFQQV